MSKEEIFDKVKNILVSEFELDEGDVTPDALLGDDLDLDSIDSIDLIVKMKEFMPADKGNVDPSIFKTVKTVQDVVDALEDIIVEKLGEATFDEDVKIKLSKGLTIGAHRVAAREARDPGNQEVIKVPEKVIPYADFTYTFRQKINE